MKPWGSAFRHVAGKSIWCLAALLFWNAQGLAAEAERYAVVHKVSGTVIASTDAAGANVPSRNLKPGDVVRVGETVRSGPSSEVVLRTDDSGVIAMRPSAQMAMNRFSQGGKEGDHFSLHIATGAVRLITGLIGQRSKENYRVSTPTATMGVRGTDYEAYVVTSDMAKTMGQREGTYNRVYKGGTTLDLAGQVLEIGPGQVGLAPAAPPAKTRAIFTVLAPVLLERVPDFFVPGAFDGELESLVPPASQTGAVAPAKASGPAKSRTPAGGWEAQLSAFRGDADTEACAPNRVAKAWLDALDDTLRRRDAAAFVAMFAADSVITAHLKTAPDATTAIELDRDELAQSTMKAMAGLSDFATERPITRAARGRDASQACSSIEIRSVVLEKGSRAGVPYTMEALEAFSLELRAGRWLAVAGSTRPR